jgi:ribonuclease D
MFDTQVAAMAAGFGDQVAYDSLVRQMLKIDLDKGSRFTDWSRRPLSDAQLHYAMGDVTHLAALYPKLRDRLKRKADWTGSCRRWRIWSIRSSTTPIPKRPGSV